MVRVLLINDTNVPLKYFVRGLYGTPLIAPEMFDTLFPGTEEIIGVDELLLRWEDADGKRYGEIFNYRESDGDKTLIFGIDAKTLLFEFREYDGIKRPGGRRS